MALRISIHVDCNHRVGIESEVGGGKRTLYGLFLGGYDPKKVSDRIWFLADSPILAYGNLRSNASLISRDNFKNELLASPTTSSFGIIPSNLDRLAISVTISRFKSSMLCGCSFSIIDLLFALYHRARLMRVRGSL